ncbi:uncharacterized protein MELLADRAFT_96129 [Melampsora larici-populina 98AG31]|uniref:Uncharacterized protein n=1 Tax=Melampsora larici-populina (strain 98AG31 / pathotype 3-4-7) TaxID=747676 RepID=F4SB29_MELLP|nr:uncharacterized protein MELLADRAFT_96129 [Melampsora larici-populina 98AG31]EGF98147.1 hypothetical protein MELLADRAFT_96129 [Melampsora larici-populina 98AG31]
MDDGMFWRVNRTMDAVFGADVIDKNLFSGCYGMEFVLEWLDKARKHATWDNTSDQLINIKLENIREALIKHGALLPEPRHRPAPSPKATKGKKRRVISETLVSPIKIVEKEGLSPPAKRLQIESKSSRSVDHSNTENENTSDVEILSCSIVPSAKPKQSKYQTSSTSVGHLDTEEENTSDLEIISCSIVNSKKHKPSKSSSSTKAVSSNLKSAKKNSKSAPTIQNHHTSNSKSKTLKTSVHSTRPVSTVLTGCPLTSGEMICTRCKLKDDDNGLEFLCHCGHKGIKLYGGRAQNAEVHWASNRCTSATREIRQTASASLFFAKSVPNKEPIISKPLIPCAGINDKTWKRPKATRDILACIKGASNIYHGCRPREVICKEMFGFSAHSKLDDDQRQRWQNQCKAEATWWINRSSPFQTIHSTKCLGTLPRVLLQGMHPEVCTPCWDLRKDSTLKNAINKDYSVGESVKYTSRALMEPDLLNAKRRQYEHLDALSSYVENPSKSGDQKFWQGFTAMALEGKFDNNDVLKGLLMAVTNRQKRENEGKGLTGMHFEPYFDDFIMTLAAISPKCADLFTETLAGRGPRSRRYIRANEDLQMAEGLALSNFARVKKHLQEIGYDGPVSVGTDETVCVKALRVSGEFIVGSQGGDVHFESMQDLTAKVKDLISHKQLCSKIRAYTVQVPLPGVPTYVVALLPSNQNETAEDVCIKHESFLTLAQDAGLKVLSLGSDGAATEMYPHQNPAVWKQSDTSGDCARPKTCTQDRSQSTTVWSSTACVW